MAMTRLAVRDLVRALVAFDPEQYIETDADLNTLISERADAFAIQARAFLVRETATVSASVTPGPLSIASRTFGDLGLTNATDVWVNSVQLVDLFGRPGPTSTQNIADRYRDYLSTAPGTPRHWSSMGPDRLEIWPSPAADASVTILGTGLHGPLATEDAETRFPSELDRSFCYDVAAQLLFPRANGDTLTRANALATMAREAAEAYAKRAENQEGGRRVRGWKKGTNSRRIGWGM